ncbi:MAG: hypothetical protein HYY38_00340 [Rhodospirillales bacterium]|nr:hypothetical protein [Rhodospirillales bacterium]
MVLVDWRDDFKIGIDSVDYEHRQMIELINAVHEKLRRGVHTHLRPLRA